MIYLFSLGRTIPLCLAELQALLKINKIDYKILNEIENNVIIEITGEVDVQDLLKQSGGIVKIGRQMTVRQYDSETVTGTTVNWEKYLSNITIKQYNNFGVSLVGYHDDVRNICEQLKPQIKLHYILPKEGHELSSAQIINKNILEFTIVKIGKEYQVFQTQCVQDINYWTKKDAGRPFIDDRLGMLPLKVARMMVNLGKGGRDGIEGRDGVIVLDPFCGMGSILAEAIDLGIKNVVGGDINAEVLNKCEKNLQWFCEKFMYKHANMLMLKTDATNISDNLSKKVDLIVTEPFLGDAQKIKEISNVEYRKGDTTSKIKNIVRGLEKMYLGCLKDWKRILKPEGVVCIIVPEIELDRKVFTIPFVEICSKTGYNIINQPLEYSREQAVVKRKIYLLRQS